METTRKKIAFHTLGCKLNFTETSAIAGMFPGDQFERVPASTKADIYVINSCTVTESADRKCRQAVRKFINQAPEAFIAVIGCNSQLNHSSLSSIPGVDLVLGSNEKYDIRDYLGGFTGHRGALVKAGPLTPSDNFHHAFSIGDRTRSFLKVQDGCDYNCSYCTVPLARGKSRNPTIKSLLGQAEEIAAGGVKEIVLTGVNTGHFGKSTGESLAELLRELIKIRGIERFRISSIEPDLLTDELIGLASESVKIMPHFHLPLQSGCDKILDLMKRRYSAGDFTKLIDRIRLQIPTAAIGADIITGFPGESEADFEETYNLIRRMDISYLHVFPFSPRPGTEAEKMPNQVKYIEKEKRTKELISLSRTKQLLFNNMNIGSIQEVLFERTKSRGMISGFTPNYIRVWHPWESDLAGRIKKVMLRETASDGRIIVEIKNI